MRKICSACIAFFVWLGVAYLTASYSSDQPQPPATGAHDTPEASLIERGAYLSRAANCISCHTASGGDPFAGGRAFQTTYAFLGQLYSSNITTDRATGIGAWTQEDFIRAMRFGVAPGGRHLFPAFPYTAFTKLSTPDLEAILAYLRTLPAVKSTPPANGFWFRQRWVMAIWNWLFFNPGELIPAVAKSNDWNRGAYLVEALGHCGACHRPRNLLMAERASAPLSGGLLVDEVSDGKVRRWSAPALTPAKSGLEAWSADDLHKYLKTGHSRRAGVFGPMNEVYANSLRYLTDEDIGAMVTYLRDTSAVSPETPRAPALTDRAAGQALYDRYCEDCHLSTGRGALRKGPSIAGSAIVQAKDPSTLLNVILYGASPSPEVATAFDAYDDMPPFGSKLNTHAVAVLANFVRGNWDNSGDFVSDSAVARQR